MVWNRNDFAPGDVLNAFYYLVTGLCKYTLSKYGSESFKRKLLYSYNNNNISSNWVKSMREWRSRLNILAMLNKMLPHAFLYTFCSVFMILSIRKVFVLPCFFLDISVLGLYCRWSPGQLGHIFLLWSDMTLLSGLEPTSGWKRATVKTPKFNSEESNLDPCQNTCLTIFEHETKALFTPREKTALLACSIKRLYNTDLFKIKLNNLKADLATHLICLAVWTWPKSQAD